MNCPRCRRTVEAVSLDVIVGRQGSADIEMWPCRCIVACDDKEWNRAFLAVLKEVEKSNAVY